MKVTALAVAIVAASCTHSVQAWWDAGHMVTAQIAVDYLNGVIAPLPLTPEPPAITSPAPTGAPTPTTTPAPETVAPTIAPTAAPTPATPAPPADGDSNCDQDYEDFDKEEKKDLPTVRRLQSAKLEAATIEKILAPWEDDFPGTSTAPGAAIWPDLIKCNTLAPFCPDPSTPSVSFLSVFHFTSTAFGLNGYDTTKIPPNQINALGEEAHAAKALSGIVNSFRTSKSKWAWNFQLRMLIHIMGDIHNPCHSVSSFSSVYPRGDQGCNLWRLPPSCPGLPSGVDNLHKLTDSVGGTMTYNWAPVGHGLEQVLEMVRGNASSLLASESIVDSLNLAKAEDMSFNQFASYIGSEKIFDRIINESMALAIENVYRSDIKFELNANKTLECPPLSYINNMKAILKNRVALGGYRMGIVLKKIAQQYLEVFPN